ncbi:Holliday junction resolvase RuvX [Desulfurobacterium thermolithotrophum]|uniref:Holliday junction resolvase RuvX n=1 Tax=Desulfurobacterium thermolithotrophum TaxID=64160 RepID=UPI0013CF7C2D|nr:Holliday junction resolvase RuvX [Desulfurobacterium thermolithotrophum]
MKRVMALDVGFKKIGIAVSDPLLLTANPHSIIYRKSNKETFSKLLELIEKLNVGKIIIGIPISSEGKETKMAEKIKKFALKLDSFLKEQGKKIEIIFVDESYSSLEAKELCRFLGKTEKEEIDDVAAALMLKEWLENANQS